MNLLKLLQQLIQWILSLFQPKPKPPPVPPVQAPPITQKILVITHNPILRSQDNKRMHEYFGWQHPDGLVQGCINDLRESSYGYLQIEVVEHIVVDGFPLKADGFRYDEDTYLEAWRSRVFHQPDAVDYLALVNEFRLIERIDSGEIDEIWLMGHPYGGYYESIMAGPGAFWCNSPPLKNTDHATRRFIIMGYNFERGVGEMLESYGHRVESIMDRVYQSQIGERNLWRRFTRYDQIAPGQAECGNVHFAPNSERDYDWGNLRTVPSRCDNWYTFPDLSGKPRQVNATEWGSGDIRKHHTWWMRHFPHLTGETNGILNNWWAYIVDPNKV